MAVVRSMFTCRSILSRYAVAEHFLRRSPSIIDEHKQVIIEHMAMVHQSANVYCERHADRMKRTVYVMSRHYLDYIQTFLHLYNEKANVLTRQAERLHTGIVRIDEARVLIQDMNRKLDQQRQELGLFECRCFSTI
jgi:dynein heavy chain, axonemal